MNFPVANKSLGCQVIPEFLRKYSAEIRSNSVNSFAIFADHVGSNTELLFSAREILGRREWKTLLNDEAGNLETKRIHAEQLKKWISQRLSPEASQPWIQAISGIVGGSGIPQSNQSEMSSLLSVESLGPWRFSSIAILTALLTAGLLVALKKYQGQDSNKLERSDGGRSVQSLLRPERNLLSRQENFQNARQLPASGAFGEASAGRTISQHYRSEDEFIKMSPDAKGKQVDNRNDANPGFKSHYNAGVLIQALNRNLIPTSIPAKTISSSTSRLLQLAEEGSIDPDRLLLSNASSYASHWVQQISATMGTPASYRLRLRTDSQLSKSVCERIIKDYQSHYQSSGHTLAVIIESSRYRRAGLSQGYLPFCRSVGFDQVEYIKYG
jgi:hypothetical protein